MKSHRCVVVPEMVWAEASTVGPEMGCQAFATTVLTATAVGAAASSSSVVYGSASVTGTANCTPEGSMS